MSSQLLTDLPLEMFLLVVENLECEKDINALSQVNLGLYALLNPYLYRINAESHCRPAISWGAFYGQEATVRKALEQGASAKFPLDKCSPAPMTLAALGGHAHIVRLLLDHGVEPMSLWRIDTFGRNFTHLITVEDWWSIKLPELYPARDWAPWTAALTKNHADVLQVLIEHDGFVPRDWDFVNTAIEGRFETLKVLVRACPEWADLVGPEYNSVFGIAIDASPNNLDIARFLIDSGSPVNYICDNQHTPLAYAAYSGNIETVKLLLNRGADPDPETPLWPLKNAAERGHVEIAELLLEKMNIRGKITYHGDDQFWLLYSVAACGFENIVRACLDAGCNTNGRLYVPYCSFHVDDTYRASDGGYNLTPLDWARGRGHSAIVRLLENNASLPWEPCSHLYFESKEIWLYP
ncbi:hypothetical protein N7517_009831 [Penicillium concentricum]|uniref:F-box domain-containing protein n=1 Tax=Penicillium concentricum TaxID=293559 RepID=A0A9W9UZ96_9EURO|nr:uncharacterized protein N7517_009831 [Penicillium concentricum]KAJ5360640.1 hypothetical protein N7517_009831 [Penicillium concentricum]